MSEIKKVVPSMDSKGETQPDPAKPTPKRLPPLRRLTYGVGSEFRRFWYRVTRENIAGFLWTLAWTIPITVFIWVYAESEQEKKDPGRPISITIQSDDPHKIATVDPDDQTVMCDLKGPQANVDNFIQALSPTKPLKIEVNTAQMHQGENHIPSLDYLKDNTEFTKAGVILETCSPPTLRVYVDNIMQVKLPVHRPPQAPPNIPGLQNATFDPATVLVSGPAKIVQDMTDVQADLSSLPPVTQTGSIPVINIPLIHDSSVTCTPASVKATLIVAEQDEKHTVTNVAIYTQVPPQLLNRYTISVSSFAPPFDVVGPPTEIDQIDQLQKSGAVRAILEINPENVTTTAPVPLKIEGLPPDVHPVTTPEMTFTATSTQ